MRIVCEQCQTKYIVPDEKIVKNVLRLTCQKCGHVITARVNDAQPELQDRPSGTLEKWRSEGSGAPKRTQNDATPVWYYSYNGESFGPFTEIELKDKLLSEKMAAIAEKCYVWRKSFSEWKPVLDVEPFASAILMPPPPPPAPKPEPKIPDSTLPPLFSTTAPRESLSSAANTATKTSSPDLQNLKLRLQRTPNSVGSIPERQRESLARLANIDPIPKSDASVIQDSAPTHPSFPVVHSNEKSVELPKDKKPLGLPLSLKPLDASKLEPEKPVVSAFEKMDLGNAVKSAQITVTGMDSAKTLESEPAEEDIQKAFSPAAILSKKTTEAAAKSTLSPASLNKPKPLSGLSFKKSSLTDASLGFTKPGASSDASKTGVPRFASLHSIATKDKQNEEKKEEQSIASLFNAPKPVKDELSDMPDFKEDIGGLLDSSDGSNLSSVKKADKSASKPEDSLAVPTVEKKPHSADKPSLNVLELNRSKTLLSDSSFPRLNLDSGTSDLFKSDANLEPSDSGESLNSLAISIDLSADLSMDDAPSARKDVLVSESATMSDSLELDMEEPEIVSSADPEVDAAFDLPDISLDDESKMPAANLNAVEEELGDEELGDIDLADSQPALNVTSPEADEPDIVDLDAIDFDNDDDVSAGAADRVAKTAKAQASNDLDRIMSEHQDLFAEADALEAEHEAEESVSESSMLIQLEHLQRAERKDSRKRLFVIVAAFAIIGLIAAGILIGRSITVNHEPRITSGGPEFAQAEGHTISEDELDRMIPSDEFEIVDAKPAKAQEKAAAPKKTKPASNSGRESANAQAADAIYGNQKAEEPVKKSAAKSDGRANVMFGSNSNTDDFANTDAVKGSKYANQGAGGDAFTLGLRRISQTVQECYRREAKNGNMMNVPKIYLKITVQPDGSVSDFSIDKATVPDSFNTCLKSKKDRWKFEAFDGNPVTLRQAFVLQ